MDPSIQSALTDEVLKANSDNSHAIAVYKDTYANWAKNAPLYAACIPPVKGPDEPAPLTLRFVNAAVFEQIYLKYNAQRQDLGSEGGNVNIDPAFEYKTYERPVEVVAGPPKQPKNPIGVLVSAPEDDVHAPAFGDVMPLGSLHEIRATGVTYQKMPTKPNPMGIAGCVWVPVEA